jgi:hypothetical protein
VAEEDALRKLLSSGEEDEEEEEVWQMSLYYLYINSMMMQVLARVLSCHTAQKQ